MSDSKIADLELRASSPRARWRDSSDARDMVARERAKTRRTTRLLLLLVTALLGAAAGVATWRQPKPEPLLLPICISSYQSPWIPDNLPASRDAHALLASECFSEPLSRNVGFIGRRDLVEQLKLLSDVPADRSIVVYVAAYAAVDDNGRIALLPSDVVPTRPDTRVSLAHVMKALQGCPSTRKLLVLDISWDIADPRIGILRNDVAAAVDEEIQATPDPHRLVLTSCSAGQTALVSPELGRSVFGYFFEQGLLGKADGHGDNGRADGRIAVTELAAYLTRCTSVFSRETTMRRQTASLQGDGESFALATTAHPTSTGGAKAPTHKAKTYPEWLADGWRTQQQWRTAPVDRRVPRITARMASTLMDLEHRWRYGETSDALEETWKWRLVAYQKDRAAALARIAGPPTFSAPSAVAVGYSPNPKIADALTALLATCGKKPPAKDEKGASGVLGWLGLQGDAKDKADGSKKAAPAESTSKPKNAAPKSDDKKLPTNDATASTKKESAASKKPPAPQEPPRIIGPDGLTDVALRTFLAEAKGGTAVDVASAIDTALLSAPAPNVERLRLYHFLLTRFDDPRILLERSYLAALVDMADRQEAADADWPADDAVELLRLVFATERLRDHAFAGHWIAPSLQDALIQREEAESRFWNRRRRPPSMDDDSMRRVRTLLEAARHHARLIDDAVACYLDSLEWLESASRLAESHPDLHAECAAAFAAADALRQELALGADHETSTGAQRLQRRAIILRRTIEDLQAPLSQPIVDPLFDEHLRIDTQRLAAEAIGDLLKMSCIDADLRVKLCARHETLCERLVQSALEACSEPPDKTPYTREPWTASRDQEAGYVPGVRRVEASVRLLQLGGVTSAPTGHSQLPTTRAEIEKQLREHPGQLALQLASAWEVVLPARLDSNDGTLEERVRASLVFPGHVTNNAIDAPSNDPWLAAQLGYGRRLWTALSDFYAYAAADQLVPPLYDTMASEFAIDAPASPFPIVSVTDLPLTVSLSMREPASELTLPWRLVNAKTSKGAPPEVAYRVLTPSDALTVASFGERNARPDEPLRLNVALNRQSPPARSDADGFLVEFTADGRVFHIPVNVPALADAMRDSLRMYASPKPVGDATTAVRLRPTGDPATQYLFVHNGTRDTRSYRIRLAADPPLETDMKVAPGQTLPVRFAAPIAPVESAPPVATTAAPAPITVASPLRFELLDATTLDLLDEIRIDASVVSPRSYVRMRGAAYQPGDAKTNRLTVELQAIDPPPGAPCSAELVLNKATVPSLKAAAGGTFKAKMTPQQPTASLSASGLTFSGIDLPKGRFSISVDGEPNVFLFDATFPESGSPITPTQLIRPSITLRAPPFADSLKPLPVHTTVLNPPPGVQLRLSVGRYEGGRFLTSIERLLPTPLDARITLDYSGKDGALALSGALTDWDVDLDVQGVAGSSIVRVEMLDPRGQVVASDETPVVLGGQSSPNISFLDLPTVCVLGRPMDLTVAIVDNPLGVESVVFFLGKPDSAQGRDGAATMSIPPKAPTTPGAPLDPTNKKWSASLTVPKDHQGAADISVCVTDRAHGTHFATATLLCSATAPPSAGPKGAIAGVVLEGPRPQANLTVTLAGPAKATTKTDAHGRFQFENLKPGEYTISSKKPTSGRKGEAKVQVDADAIAQVKVELQL